MEDSRLAGSSRLTIITKTTAAAVLILTKRGAPLSRIEPAGELIELHCGKK